MTQTTRGSFSSPLFQKHMQFGYVYFSIATVANPLLLPPKGCCYSLSSVAVIL